MKVTATVVEAAYVEGSERDTATVAGRATAEIRRKEDETMFQHILVPLDGSGLAERALPLAERVARATGATMHLVRVIVPPSGQELDAWAADAMYLPTDYYTDMLDSEMRHATAYLDRIHAQMSAAGLRVQAAPLIGHAAAALLDYERTAGIDLVVMSSHGRSGLARVAFGSVADRLLHHGAVPILLVQASGDPASLGGVVVPLDGSAQAEEALGAVMSLPPDLLGEVTLLRVINAPEQGPEAERYLAGVAERLRRAQLAPQCRVEQGDPAAAISAAAGTTRLVAMTTHGRSGVTRWVLGSVADRVAHRGPTSMLLVRAGTISTTRPCDETRQLVSSGST